jgi:DNA-binding MarR family transcriptional regulator
MVSRGVTQLYDDVLRPSGLRVTQFSILANIALRGEANLKQLEAALAIDQTTLTRSLNLLERDGVIERAPHPDRRIKSMRLTAKGRRALKGARPLWAQAQDKVLRELGTKAWADAPFFAHRITNAVSEGLNSKIQTIKKMAYGFRNREHFKTAIYFHCGGLDLYPAIHEIPG